MPDREKVIKGLEVCRDQDNPPGHRFTGCKDDCPYYGNGCAKKLKEDAMDQLKEQPEIVLCKDCKWWSKSKLKCYRPYANRQSNSNSFCDKGIRKNVQ